MAKKEPEIIQRPMAMIGKVLAVSCPQGTPIFDLGGNLLGHVADRKPVYNGNTVYLSTNDYNAAKAALPAAPKKIIH